MISLFIPEGYINDGFEKIASCPIKTNVSNPLPLLAQNNEENMFHRLLFIGDDGIDNLFKQIPMVMALFLD